MCLRARHFFHGMRPSMSWRWFQTTVRGLPLVVVLRGNSTLKFLARAKRQRGVAEEDEEEEEDEAVEGDEGEESEDP